jgi:hypothetical protein
MKKQSRAGHFEPFGFATLWDAYFLGEVIGDGQRLAYIVKC